DHDVLARLERLERELEVRGHRQGDHDGGDLIVANHILPGCNHRDRRMLLAGAASRLTVGVAYRDKLRGGTCDDVPSQIRPPIAIPHDARRYPCRFHLLAARLWSIARGGTARRRLRLRLPEAYA